MHVYVYIYVYIYIHIHIYILFRPSHSSAPLSFLAVYLLSVSFPFQTWLLQRETSPVNPFFCSDLAPRVKAPRELTPLLFFAFMFT